MRKSGKTQPCGKRAPGRELHLKESSKRVPGQRPGWEERRGGMVCGKHDSTVLGVRSEWPWGEGMWGEEMFHMVTHHSRCSNTTAPAEHHPKRSNTLPFP